MKGIAVAVSNSTVVSVHGTSTRYRSWTNSERGTDIKTLKMVYGDVRGSVPYWANEYRDRAALNPPDTNTIGQNIQKIKRKRCF